LKATIEFSTREIIILLIMIALASILIILNIKYSNNIKSAFDSLIAKFGELG
jgi:hypothetical protein